MIRISPTDPPRSPKTGIKLSMRHLLLSGGILCSLATRFNRITGRSE